MGGGGAPGTAARKDKEQEEYGKVCNVSHTDGACMGDHLTKWDRVRTWVRMFARGRQQL